MSTLKTHVLVRQISRCNPDGGGSVFSTQIVKVKIEWPEIVPPDISYGSNGQWVVSEEV